ncbi:MAG TPA: hypothetical protein PKA64_15355 [Myxococcota bacterium]|nr:hypothetical protein [Myxococcota bacterium]
MRAGAALALLAACDAGPADPTVIDELTVLAIVAHPPEVAPGQSLGLDVWAVDPAGRAADLAVWSCTPWDDGCAEATVVGAPLERWTWARRDARGPQHPRFDVPLEAVAAIPPPAQTASVYLWALACRPGACDLPGLLLDPPPDGTPERAALMARLADPYALLDGRPFDEASLAVHRIVLSLRSPESRNLPPVVLRIGDEPLMTRPGGSLSLSFLVTDALVVWPYATGGGFEYPRYAVADGGTGVRWLAPDRPGVFDLFVIADDAIGGTALWSGQAIVAW